MKVTLKAEERQKKGRRSRNLLREEGRIPAVIYGKDIDSLAVSVENSDILKFLREFGSSQLLALEIDEDLYNVVIKETQRDPISQQLIHLDFHRVALDELTTALVPVILIGEPEGTNEGCILQQHIREVEVECLPTDIPERIELDVSEMKVDDDVFISDIDLDEGVSILDEDEDAVVATLFYYEIDEEDLEVDEEVEEPELIVEETAEDEEEVEE